MGWIELGSRGHEILAKALEGLTNRQIADEFLISERTVKNYMSTIYLQFHYDSYFGRNHLLGELFQILNKEMRYSLNDILSDMTSESFSVDEWIMLRLLFEGASRKEIGKEIGLQERTIKDKLIPVYAKLGVSGRGLEGLIKHLAKMIADDSMEVAEILLRKHSGYSLEN